MSTSTLPPTPPDERPTLAWLALRGIGGAIAALVVAALLAGRAGLPIAPALLLAAAALGLLPSLRDLARGRWRAAPGELATAALALALVGGVSLWLAWPALLPLGRSVDAVHQFQLVDWVAREQRLPPLDSQTRGLMGEMIAYPPGFAFFTNALAALARTPALEATFPAAALLGGLCAALVALLAAQAGGATGWRALLGLAAPLLLLAHRMFFLDAYIDHSYYAQMLGLLLVLLVCAWATRAQPLTPWDAAQAGLALAALEAAYPLWLPVPAAALALAALAPWRAGPWRGRAAALALALAPTLALVLVDLPARMRTGQLVLEHQGVVADPTLHGLAPLLLAAPAALVLAITSAGGAGLPRWAAALGRVPTLALLLALALLELAGLGLAARLGLAAPYHSTKMLFVAVPLGAALVGAALTRLAGLRAPMRWAAPLGAALLVLASAPGALPLAAEHIPTPDLVRAARWLRASDPKAAEKAVLVGAPAGPMAYWLQVALLGQRRDQAEAAMAALAAAPPTTEGWAMDRHQPKVAVSTSLSAPPPGTEVLAQFGHVAVLRRASLDRESANPLVVRYSSRLEDGRLKAALELVHPISGTLPLAELRLLRGDDLVARYPLAPREDVNKDQYLGVEIDPATLGGSGYINDDSFPSFAPPAAAPEGHMELRLRLSFDGVSVDERTLASFDRTQEGQLLNLSPHSGELVYLRREDSAPVAAAHAQFGAVLALDGWQSAGVAEGALSVRLRWHAQTPIRRPVALELRLLDASGATVASSAGAPQGGFYPVWRWRAGEIVAETRSLALPADLPAGAYTLAVAAFDEGAQAALPLTEGSATLGQVRIP
ncbi:hypothetical protein F8S13_08260 [Chloroflexia bacterium SDU3-3]|nr:hypothetical protein F8S13_08260 [Chloroflexia bacterium SDU3-3]